jgi:hypothetical protein
MNQVIVPCCPAEWDGPSSFSRSVYLVCTNCTLTSTVEAGQIPPSWGDSWTPELAGCQACQLDSINQTNFPQTDVMQSTRDKLDSLTLLEDPAFIATDHDVLCYVGVEAYLAGVLENDCLINDLRVKYPMFVLDRQDRLCKLSASADQCHLAGMG